jgi:hypothetical protein
LSFVVARALPFVGCPLHSDEARWPSGKAAACKAAIRGFDSRPRLQSFLAISVDFQFHHSGEFRVDGEERALKGLASNLNFDFWNVFTCGNVLVKFSANDLIERFLVKLLFFGSVDHFRLLDFVAHFFPRLLLGSIVVAGRASQEKLGAWLIYRDHAAADIVKFFGREFFARLCLRSCFLLNLVAHSVLQQDLLTCLGGACLVPMPNRGYLHIRISRKPLIGKGFVLSRQDEGW